MCSVRYVLNFRTAFCFLTAAFKIILFPAHLLQGSTNENVTNVLTSVLRKTLVVPKVALSTQSAGWCREEISAEDGMLINTARVAAVVSIDSTPDNVALFGATIRNPFPPRRKSQTTHIPRIIQSCYKAQGCASFHVGASLSEH